MLLFRSVLFKMQCKYTAANHHMKSSATINYLKINQVTEYRFILFCGCSIKRTKFYVKINLFGCFFFILSPFHGVLTRRLVECEKFRFVGVACKSYLHKTCGVRVRHNSNKNNNNINNTRQPQHTHTHTHQTKF